MFSGGTHARTVTCERELEASTIDDCVDGGLLRNGWGAMKKPKERGKVG